MGFAKPHGEVLVAGKAFAENQIPVDKMQVSVELANIKKHLKVIGDRQWTGSFFSPASMPRKFTEMPLLYQHSYGGVDHLKNPIGKGIIKKKYKEESYYHLPNIYLAKESTHPDSKEREIAGFGPLDICWPQRACYQGTYNKHWLEHDHPGFPKDTNPQLFNAAPADQQIKGYFKPGDAYQVKGMNPEFPIIKGHIPQVTVRAFIEQEVESKNVLKEIETAIDTVWFFPELELGVVIHRGVMQVNDSDGLDVKKLMLACEGAQDNPRTVDYYEHVLNLRTDAKTALGHVFNESQLMPIKTKIEQQAYDELYAQAKRLNQQKVEKLKALHLTKIQAENPDVEILPPQESEADQKEALDEPGPIPQELLDSGDIDLSPYIDYANAMADKAKIDMEKALEDAKAQQVKHANRVNKEVESITSIQARINDIVFVIATDLKTCAPSQLPEWATLLPHDLSLEDDQQQKIQQAADIAAVSARQARQNAPSMTVLPLPLPKNGSRLMREKVIELMKLSQLLAGRDLAGADLSGLDFSGMDMRDVMLEQTNLSGCNFTHCKLDGAVFTGATLDSTIFSHSSMTKTNFSLSHGKEASFNNADLSHTNLTQAVFDSCDFSDAILNHVLATNVNMQFSKLHRIFCTKGNFVEAKLAHSNWRKSNIDNCIFLQPDLQFIQWEGVTMDRCIVVEANAQGAHFSEVRATKVQFSNKGDFRQANISKSYWNNCGFRGLDLTQCNGSDSVFVECDFGEAILDSANLTRSLLNSCIMTLTRFNKSNCQETYFNNTSLRKSQFIDVDMRNSDIVNSDMTEVLFKHCLTKNMTQKPMPSID